MKKLLQGKKLGRKVKWFLTPYWVLSCSCWISDNEFFQGFPVQGNIFCFLIPDNICTLNPYHEGLGRLSDRSTSKVDMSGFLGFFGKLWCSRMFCPSGGKSTQTLPNLQKLTVDGEVESHCFWYWRVLRWAWAISPWGKHSEDVFYLKLGLVRVWPLQLTQKHLTDKSVTSYYEIPVPLFNGRDF